MSLRLMTAVLTAGIITLAHSVPARAETITLICRSGNTVLGPFKATVGNGINVPPENRASVDVSDDAPVLNEIRAHTGEKWTTCVAHKSEEEALSYLKLIHSTGFTFDTWKPKNTKDLNSKVAPTRGKSYVFYIDCIGTHYTYQGRTYNPTTTPMMYKANSIDDETTILKYVISKWALNKPADTWTCKKFSDDDHVKMTAYQEYLLRNGYDAGIRRDDDALIRTLSYSN